MGIGVVGPGITVPGIPPGAIHAGPTTLGCPGSLVALDGLDGPGFLAGGLDPVADAASEILGIVTRSPSPGLLTVLGLNGAYTYDGGPDYALVTLWVNGLQLVQDVGYGPGVSYVQLGAAAWGGELIRPGATHGGAWDSSSSAAVWGGAIVRPGAVHSGAWQSLPAPATAGRRARWLVRVGRLRRTVNLS